MQPLQQTSNTFTKRTHKLNQLANISLSIAYHSQLKRYLYFLELSSPGLALSDIILLISAGQNILLMECDKMPMELDKMLIEHDKMLTE